MLIKFVSGLAKSALWFVHYSCVPGLNLDSTFLLTASILKPIQTHFIARPLWQIKSCDFNNPNFFLIEKIAKIPIDFN